MAEDKQNKVLTTKKRLASYSHSNLQKLNLLITILTEYLELEGAHLGEKVSVKKVIVSKDELSSKGLEVAQFKKLIYLLDDIIGNNLFTFPFDEELLGFKHTNSYYEISGGDRERHKREWLELMSSRHGFNSGDELEKNIIIQYHSDDVYKIIRAIQLEIRTILGEKNVNKLYEPAGEEVSKIEILKHEPNTNKIKVIINGHSERTLSVSLRKYWSILYEIAEKQQVIKNKPFFDYFNSNINNPIYYKLGYKQSQILQFDGAVRIIPKVIIEVISNKKFAQRKNKAA